MGSIIGLWKCWNFQDKAKLGQIILVVTARSVSRFYILVESTQMIIKTLKMIILINPIDRIDMKPTASIINRLFQVHECKFKSI